MTYYRPRRLKVVKPVCECKYERKIVERNEERIKWKGRQQRLKASKKQSFMHIADLSRPMIEDTKFIISEVKRMEDENDIKYCISGVAENISMSSPQKIIDGLKMSTPFQTPVSSEEDILQTAMLHRHWSPTNIPPGPLPRRDASLKEKLEHRRKATDEAFKLIYGDKEQNASYSITRNNQGVFDDQKLLKNIEKKKDNMKKSNMNKKMSKTINELQSLNEKNSNRIEYQNNASYKKVREKKRYSEEAGEVDHQNISYKQVIDKMEERTDRENHRMSGGSDKKYINNKSDLIAIMKVFSRIFLS